jgi:hypothetical protein
MLQPPQPFDEEHGRDHQRGPGQPLRGTESGADRNEAEGQDGGADAGGRVGKRYRTTLRPLGRGEVMAATRRAT